MNARGQPQSAHHCTESADAAAPVHSPQPEPRLPSAGHVLAGQSSSLALHSITKTVSIDASAAAVFAFMADIANWPRWAVVKAQPLDREWWEVVTSTGTATLRMRSNVAFGILDHDFDAFHACTTIPARIVPNGTGSELMITFTQPRKYARAAFDRQMALVDRELQQLKRLLESSHGAQAEA